MARSGLVTRLAPLGALLALGLLAWVWEAAPPQEGAVEPQRLPAAALPARPLPAAADGPRAAAPAARAPQPLLALLTAPPSQMRASLDRAMRMRAQGGRLYARALARRCAELDANPSAGPAFDALRSGCGQVLVSEWLALVNIAADESGPTDPLLQMLEHHEAQPAHYAALLASPDPLLLDELGPRLLWQRDGNYYFDGQHYRDEAARALIEGALSLLPCDLGLGCAAERLALHEHLDPAALQALRARLLDAVQSRAVARFLPN